MTNYKSTRIIDGKPRCVVVDETGKITNKNPIKEELKGLEKEPYHIRSRKDYTDEELINILKQFVKEKGRSPIVDDFENNPAYPHWKTYHNRFGSWQNALEIGLDKNGKIKYTNDELLHYLTDFEKENQRPPTTNDFNNNPRYPSFVTYARRFGSWENSLRRVGLDVDTMVMNGNLSTNQQKGRFAEIIVRNHFKKNPIDLAEKNQNSPCDGICPNGKYYDVKSCKLDDTGHFHGYYHFNMKNKYKDEIELYYLLGFNSDWTKLDYAWRIPGEIAEDDIFHIGSKSWHRTKFTIENMTEYVITDKIRDIIDMYIEERK